MNATVPVLETGSVFLTMSKGIPRMYAIDDDGRPAILPFGDHVETRAVFDEGRGYD